MKNILIISSCLCLIACNYWKHYNHDYTISNEDLIKDKMCHFGDFSLNRNDVNLIKQGFYYVGHVKYQDEAYFLGYFNKLNKIKLIRIFNKKWSLDMPLNAMIITANDSIFVKNNLNFDTIYGQQDNEKIGITLVDDKRNSISNWDVNVINDIGKFSKYQLTKCYIDKCLDLNP